MLWPNGVDLDPDVLIWGVDADGNLLPHSEQSLKADSPLANWQREDGGLSASVSVSPHQHVDYQSGSVLVRLEGEFTAHELEDIAEWMRTHHPMVTNR